MRKDDLDWAAACAFIGIAAMIGLCGAAIYGYIVNIVSIAHSTDMLTPKFILRVLGLIVVPLGIVMGFV